MTWLVSVVMIHLVIYFALIGFAKYCDEYVCLCVCLCICLSAYITWKPYDQNSPKFCSHGLVFLWWHCDTLCTSGFMDYVMFSYRGTNRQMALRLQGRLTSSTHAEAASIECNIRQWQCLYLWLPCLYCTVAVNTRWYNTWAFYHCYSDY